MEINGERMIGASQKTVWEAINDPEMLKLCIPGGESVERVSDNEMKAVVMAKIGPVRARFTGKVTMIDIVAPDSCTLIFEGTGGPAGFAKGQATVALSAQGPQETLLKFSAAATVGGKLGQIGARLIESAARAISDEFFTHLMEQLSPRPEAAPRAAAAVAPQTAAASAAPEFAAARAASGGTGKPFSATPAAPQMPAPGVHALRPGFIMVDTRWLWGIGCLVLGFLAGKYS